MMTTEQKQKLYNDEYAMFGWSIIDTYKFLNLVGTLYNSSLKKNPNVTVYELLTRLIPDHKHYIRIFERTQYHVMCHMSDKMSVFSPLGFKSAADIITEVKRLLDEWLPF